MGSRSQMLPSSVAARHSRLTQDFICFSSMLAKCVLCPSCSLIQRRVLEKKLVAMWLSKLTLAICAAVFRICSRTLPQFRLCNAHDNSFDTFQEGCNSAKLTSVKNAFLVSGDLLASSDCTEYCKEVARLGSVASLNCCAR